MNWDCKYIVLDKCKVYWVRFFCRISRHCTKNNQFEYKSNTESYKYLQFFTEILQNLANIYYFFVTSKSRNRHNPKLD